MDSLQGSQENEFTITMPALFCSPSFKMHPEAAYLIEVGDALLQEWCRRILAVSERFQLPAAKQLFSLDHNVNSAYALLATLYFANAVSTERVVPVLKLMNWFFMFDNCLDVPSMLGANVPKSEHIINSVVRVFSKPTPVTASAHHELPPPDPATGDSELLVEELAHIFSSTAAEWWSEMCVDMPLSQQARFSEVFLDYLHCMQKETPFRSAHTLPDVQEFLRIRTHSIGWYPLSVLTEYSLCMEMSEEAITSPLVVALKQNVCESIILVNDVNSFRKEYEHGDYFNIIMVLCFQKLQADHSSTIGPRRTTMGLSATTSPRVELATPEMLQESMNEACEMIKGRSQQCASIIKKIKVDHRLMEIPGMEAFLDAMSNYVSSNIYWHLTSERFWPKATFYSNGRSNDQIVNNMANVLVSHTVLLRRPSQCTC